MQFFVVLKCEILLQIRGGGVNLIQERVFMQGYQEELSN